MGKNSVNLQPLGFDAIAIEPLFQPMRVLGQILVFVPELTIRAAILQRRGLILVKLGFEPLVKLILVYLKLQGKAYTCTVVSLFYNPLF